MPELKVSEVGLVLEGPGVGTLSGVPTQAFPLMISDDVMAAMIRCVQEDGEEMQLSLGNTPTLHYGSSSHRITPPPEDFTYDLYLTKPFERTRLAAKVPRTMSILKTPSAHSTGVSARTGDKIKATKATKPLPAKAKGSGSSGVDSDVEALQNSIAAAEASKSQTGSLSKKHAKGGSKLLATTGSARTTPRSHPSSPGPSAQASPSLNPVSAMQQAVELAKKQRFNLVHELAVQERTKEHLKSKWRGGDEFEVTLGKVADFNAETKTYSMSKQYWKELDPWAYSYDSQDDRQKAIDNAVKQYDRMRMAESEPEWQKLLPAEERGKGKCLGTLQKKVARGQAAPKIQVDESEPTGREMAPVDEKPKSTKGESMSRSNSQTMASKVKKPTPTEAHIKKLLSTGSKKTAAAKVAAPIRVKDTKDKAPAKKDDKGKKTLSAEIVEDSDSEDEALAKTRMVARAKAPLKSKQAAAKTTMKPLPAKRPRDEDEEDAIIDDSSSASSTPLSKRIKPQPKPKLLPTSASSRHRASDASQSSRPTPVNGTSARSSAASSNNNNNNNNNNNAATTSPAKSSPLASSPPTNASDLEHDTARDRDRDRRRELERSRDREREREREREQEGGKKRKAAASEGLPPAKKQRLPSDETMNKAMKFKHLYQKYHALHNQISEMAHPSPDAVDQLHKMHARLATLKSEIYAETADL